MNRRLEVSTCLEAVGFLEAKQQSFLNKRLIFGVFLAYSG